MLGRKSMSAMLATMMVAAATAMGNPVVGPQSKLGGKTRSPSDSKGGRAYGRNKYGTTAAFRRHAIKLNNQRAYRVACR